MTLTTVCLGGWLTLCSLEDLRTRRMHTVLLLGGSIAGILCHLCLQRLALPNMLGGFAVGLALLVAARLSHGRIGEGDGLLLMATGTFLGFRANLLLLWTALLLAGLTGMAALMIGRRKRMRLPFAPFVAAAWLTGELLGML